MCHDILVILGVIFGLYILDCRSGYAQAECFYERTRERAQWRRQREFYESIERQRAAEREAERQRYEKERLSHLR